MQQEAPPAAFGRRCPLYEKACMDKVFVRREWQIFAHFLTKKAVRRASFPWFLPQRLCCPICYALIIAPSGAFVNCLAKIQPITISYRRYQQNEKRTGRCSFIKPDTIYRERILFPPFGLPWRHCRSIQRLSISTYKNQTFLLTFTKCICYTDYIRFYKFQR